MRRAKDESNGFGEDTYWNKPTQRRSRKLPSKYPSLKPKTGNRAPKPDGETSASRSPSPTPSQTTILFPPRMFPTRTGQQMQQTTIKSSEEDKDAKDEKSIVKLMKSALPQFSNETDWEMSIFEISLILDRVWPHKDDLDIMEYMTNPAYSSHTDFGRRANSLIYFALTTAAKKDSYAKMQIMAASHRDAVPYVPKNEGKKLYQMFQALFTMTNLHQASLPTVRAEFYAITQKENETVLQYTSRVDITVATLAKLGEKISTGAWIYALGNGLKAEYKECKDGIAYNKPGYDTVLSVKTKLLSEEAVLTSKHKKAATEHTRAVKEKEDEIALIAFKLKETQKTATTTDATDRSDTDPKDKALLFGKGKGKGKSKGNSKGKNRWPNSEQWTDQWNTQDYNWSNQGKGKGKGKGKPFHGKGKAANSGGEHWCDIHQKYGHSTDWCFDNPHRTGGIPNPTTSLWCETCNRSGHTANSCYASTIQSPYPGKGKTGKGEKGNHGIRYGDRNWKSQNFPAGYSSDQATPALHDESSSSLQPQSQEWWQSTELGTVILDPTDQSKNPDIAMDVSTVEDTSTPMMIDDNEEAISDYIDLVLFAIVQNTKRHQEFLLNPNPDLSRQMAEHSEYITNKCRELFKRPHSQDHSQL